MGAASRGQFVLFVDFFFSVVCLLLCWLVPDWKKLSSLALAVLLDP